MTKNEEIVKSQRERERENRKRKETWKDRKLDKEENIIINRENKNKGDRGK